jgi:hypothetical protein
MVVYDDGGSIVIAGDRQWQGSSGDLIADVKSKPASARQPLWVFDLTRGLIEARRCADQQIGDEPCRRFAAHTDLVRIAEAVNYEVALPFPSYDRVGDLRRIPIEVWVDQRAHIRRIRTKFAGELMTVDLTAFGTAAHLNWTQLP